MTDSLIICKKSHGDSLSRGADLNCRADESSAYIALRDAFERAKLVQNVRSIQAI